MLVNGVRIAAVVVGPDINFEGLGCGGGDEEEEGFEKTHFFGGGELLMGVVGDCERGLACMLVWVRLSEGDLYVRVTRVNECKSSSKRFEMEYGTKIVELISNAFIRIEHACGGK